MLQAPANRNVPLQARAARLLGRCHARLGEHGLSASALDAALETTKTGELLYSEALTVRARALVGRGEGAPASGDGSHWDQRTGKQRVQEVMGRMAEGGRLQEKLLLHGL